MRDRLAYSIAEAAVAADTGKTALYEALGSGELPAHKRGRRTLILAADLRLWLEKLPVLELKRTPNLSDALSQGCADQGEPNDERRVGGPISAQREGRVPISPNKLSKGCGKEENQHSSSTTGRFDDE